LKYNTPITSGENRLDSLYNEVEIKEWDKKSPSAHINKGFIQLLEARGVPKKFFVTLAQNEIDRLTLVSQDYDLLIKEYSARKYLRDSQGIFDDDVLFRMLLAGVPLDEPVMLRKVNEFIKNELSHIREKVSLEDEMATICAFEPS
jgi:hypothetical protein